VSVLVCGQASRPWRRELGAVAWAALEELALTANRDSKGWASPAGIRAIATGIGTTDIAALHAIAVLTRAGMVALGPLVDDQGRRRLAYRLFLLPGIDLRPGRSEHNELAPNRSGRLADTVDPPPPTTAGPRANSPDADRRHLGRNMSSLPARSSLASTSRERASPPNHSRITNPADSPGSDHERK
jgi:hypothetical protein